MAAWGAAALRRAIDNATKAGHYTLLGEHTAPTY